MYFIATEDFNGRVTLILSNNFVTKCRLTMALQHNFFYIPTYFLTHMPCMVINAYTKKLTHTNDAFLSYVIAFEHLLYYN